MNKHVMDALLPSTNSKKTLKSVINVFSHRGNNINKQIPLTSTQNIHRNVP